MTIRRQLVDRLQQQPRSVSSLARELGLRPSEVDEHLRHAIRSARASGANVVVLPARCRTCGFEFSEDRLVKPGKCPSCGGSRLYEAQIRLEAAG